MFAVDGERGCVYCQLDGVVPNEVKDMQEGKDEHDRNDKGEEEEGENELTELMLVPDNRALLEIMYDTIADCAALHPDVDDDEGFNPVLPLVDRNIETMMSIGPLSAQFLDQTITTSTMGQSHGQAFAEQQGEDTEMQESSPSEQFQNAEDEDAR